MQNSFLSTLNTLESFTSFVVFLVTCHSKLHHAKFLLLYRPYSLPEWSCLYPIILQLPIWPLSVKVESKARIDSIANFQIISDTNYLKVVENCSSPSFYIITHSMFCWNNGYCIRAYLSFIKNLPMYICGQFILNDLHLTVYSIHCHMFYVTIPILRYMIDYIND